MRVINSLRNMTIGIAGQILIMIGSFITRTVFIYYLSIEYLGLSGLFTNLFTIFSIANLGIGTALTYSLYQPIAQKNFEKVSYLSRILDKSFKIIGIVIFCLGLAAFPFLEILVTSDEPIEHLNLIYFIYLFNFVFPYFIGYSSRAVITAHQKEYIYLRANYITVICADILQIIVLITTENFLPYLIVQTVCFSIMYIFMRYKSFQLLPYLKVRSTVSISKKERNSIINNIKGSIFYNFGFVVTNGTDNILMSAFIGIKQVGLYANYNFLITAVQAIIRQLFLSLVASVGNLNVLGTNDRKKFIFNVLFFSNFWFFGLCAISLFILSDAFIVLWIGENYLLSDLTVFLIVVNFYLVGMQTASNTFRSALGLFWYGRYSPIITSLVNLIISLVLVQEFGINGIFVGTTLSILLVGLWFDPLIVFKYGLNTSFTSYFKNYLTYFVSVVLAGYLTYLFCVTIELEGLVGFTLKCAVCLTVPNLIFLLFFYKTNEFKYLYNIFKNIVTNKIFNIGA